METKPDDSGLAVSGVGKIGPTADGKRIYFEFLFPSGHRDRFNISFSDMDAVVLGLQAAVVEVAKKFAGQSEVSSLRSARPELLANFAVGLAMGPGLPPVVALRLNHEIRAAKQSNGIARCGGKTRQGFDRRGRGGSISTAAPQKLKIVSGPRRCPFWVISGHFALSPRYSYADMVDAQYRLLSEGLGIRHVRLIIGNSMGGMNAWLWGQKYPAYMDALVPMASQPTAMASCSWMLQRMLLEMVRNDPDYNNGNYVTQPRLMKIATVFYGIATAGGTLNYQSLAPTREKAYEFVDMRLASATATDMNDFLWQWSSSADYDPSGDLEKI